MNAMVKIPVAPEQFKSANEAGTITELNVANGDYVTEGEVIFEVEFEQFVAEIVATATGEIAKLTKSNGATVMPEETVCEVDTTATPPLHLRLGKNTIPIMTFIIGVVLTLVASRFF